ncbi:MAG: acyltransferase family protein [Lachnospiraceae bacterium]|nr:acyltransferase family protein [Lachnospiraceae bacterium]
MIPSILVTIATLIIYIIFVGTISGKKICYSLLSAVGFEAFVPDGWMFIQLWFLTYIFVCYITVPIIQRIKVNQMSGVSFWCMIICSTVILQCIGSSISLITGVPTLSWGVLLRFYLAYMLFRRNQIKSKKCKQYMLILTGLSIPLIGMSVYVRYICEPHGMLGAIAELLFIYTQTLAGIVLFYWLYLLLEHVNVNEKILKLSDKYSYAVYLTHCLFIGYSTSLIDRCSNVYIGILTALICTGISSFFVEKASGLIKEKINLVK